MIEQQYDMAADQAPDTQTGKSLSQMLIWVLLICLGWCGLLIGGSLPYQRQDVEWREPGGQMLRGEMWLPEHPAKSLPAVILVHGVMASRDQPELAARCLARDGMAVLTFDLRGYGDSDKAADTAEVHSQDVLSALAFVRAQPGIDSRRVGLIGHSMGATAVSAAAAEDGHLSLARAMGMHGEGPVEWVTGLYDALHPPGAFQKVVISPAANHHVEWFDVWLLSNHQRRFEQVFGLPAGPLPWQEWLIHWSCWGLGLGFVGILVSLLAQLQKPYTRLALLSGGIGSLVLAGYFAWLDPGLCAQGCLLLLTSYVVSHLPVRWLKTGLLLFAGLFAARELAGLLRALPWILTQPGRLLWFPLYLWQSLLYYPASALQMLKGLLFAHSHTRLEATWVLGLITLLEWLFPAWWLRIGGQLKMPAQRKRSTLVVLILGLIALAALLWIRLQQGYLAGDAVKQTISVLSTDMLPTLGFFALGLWAWKLNKKRPRDDSNIRPTV